MSDVLLPNWSRADINVAVMVLGKIVDFTRAKRPLPSEVFELMTQAKKNISTEAVVFNPRGELYLVRRPSVLDSPHEPYPDQWHSPGVTHNAYESNAEALVRLLDRELGSVTVVEQHDVGVEEVDGPPRGRYLLMIKVVLVRGESLSGSRGQFVATTNIPWEHLVESHRTTIIPAAINKARTLGWVP